MQKKMLSDVLYLPFKVFLAFCFLWTLVYQLGNAADPPFRVRQGLFDSTNTETLGLSVPVGTETITVFRPSDTTDHFSNGVVMTAFKGWLYCQWQSSRTDEDAQDTWVAYSRSQDGIHWSPPMVLAAPFDNGYHTSGGWWVYGDTLVAYINTWPHTLSPKGGYTQYSLSTDGLHWTPLKPLLLANGDTLKGIFEQDPHSLSEGRIVSAAHFQPGLNVCPIYTDDSSGIRGWRKATYTNLTTGAVSREIEPSWFLQDNGRLVMTFRDQLSSFRRLASVSTDRGETWTTAVVTDMPDSRSKQCAGNFPSGAAYLIGNPVSTNCRVPLVIVISKDGTFFDRAYVLRKGGDDLQKLRYPGYAKSPGYHYPKAMIWENYLYVSYATNKEDVEFTRVPLSSFGF